MDLDDKWAFLKTFGDKTWINYPTYFADSIPEALDFLKRKRCLITFFIIGQDATFESNRDLLSEIANVGHEVGNHTFHHDPWIQNYSKVEVDQELEKAELAIEAATKQIPRGFRGPAFTFSPELLSVLSERKYIYDASTLPSVLNPLSRLYFFMSSRLSKEEQKQRKLVFGNLKDGFRPLKSYKWMLDHNQSILEIPVTTLPFLRLPIHMTYILYLGKFSIKLAIAYFKLAVTFCKIRNIDMSVLLSPTDFLGAEDDHGLSFFPGMDISKIKKLEIIDEIISILQENFLVSRMLEQARNIEKRTDLKYLNPTR